jgi:hypothetical protein
MGVRVRHEHGDLLMVGLRLREGVVQDDVDLVDDRPAGVQLRYDDTVAVGLEHVGHPDDDHVVVVDEGDTQRFSVRGHLGTIPLGV